MTYYMYTFVVSYEECFYSLGCQSVRGLFVFKRTHSAYALSLSICEFRTARSYLWNAFILERGIPVKLNRARAIMFDVSSFFRRSTVRTLFAMLLLNIFASHYQTESCASQSFSNSFPSTRKFFTSFRLFFSIHRLIRCRNDTGYHHVPRSTSNLLRRTYDELTRDSWRSLWAPYNSTFLHSGELKSPNWKKLFQGWSTSSYEKVLPVIAEKVRYGERKKEK